MSDREMILAEINRLQLSVCNENGPRDREDDYLYDKLDELATWIAALPANGDKASIPDEPKPLQRDKVKND